MANVLVIDGVEHASQKEAINSLCKERGMKIAEAISYLKKNAKHQKKEEVQMTTPDETKTTPSQEAVPAQPQPQPQPAPVSPQSVATVEPTVEVKEKEKKPRKMHKVRGEKKIRPKLLGKKKARRAIKQHISKILHGLNKDETTDEIVTTIKATEENAKKVIQSMLKDQISKIQRYFLTIAKSKKD